VVSGGDFLAGYGLPVVQAHTFRLAGSATRLSARRFMPEAERDGR